MFVNEPSFSRCVAAGRKKTSVPISSVLRLAGLDLGAVVPEGRGLDLDEVAHDEPVELREPESLRAAVRRADRRVLAGDDVALHLPVEHLLHGPVVRVVVVDARQPVEAELVLLRSPPRPTRPSAARPCTRPCGPTSRPAPCSSRSTRAGARVVDVRHAQVAGQRVVERRDVGRALDRRVAAQRDDAAAGAAHVPEQQLDDRGGADDLDADGVLRPADRVGERATCARGRSSRRAPRRRRGTRRPCSRTRRRRAPACSARSAASGSGRRSADAAASRPRRAARRARASCRRRRAPPARPSAVRRPSLRLHALVLPASRCRTCFVSGSKPEKRPSSSSVSWNASSMITGAFV